MLVMAYLAAVATRWVEDGCPGWVEVQFIEADGRVVTLVDKTVVFDGGDGLTPASIYPVPVAVGCDLVRRERDVPSRRRAMG